MKNFSALRARRFCLLCVVLSFACLSRLVASSRSFIVSDCILSHFVLRDSVLADSATASRPCEASVSEGLRLADSALSAFAAARGNERNAEAIDSVAAQIREIHNDALRCQSHLTAMMALAASETTRKLTQSSNVLMFRMGVRDARLFLDEARRYWKERR